MNFMIRSWKTTFLGIVLVFTATGLTAQEPPDAPAEPKPAGRGIPAMGDAPIQNDDATRDQLDKWNPDTMPGTGLQSPTLGNPEFRHSYWVPGFQYSSSIQDQPTGSPNSGNWYAYNFIGANLSLLEQGSNSRLALNYSAGGFITNQPGQDNGWYQQLALAETWECPELADPSDRRCLASAAQCCRIRASTPQSGRSTTMRS
jgi:hypothetical protein